MSKNNQKRSINGIVGAYKTLNDGYPKSVSDKSDSINNKFGEARKKKQEAQDFVTDIIKKIAGYKAITEGVVNLLTTELENIEVIVKQALKTDLKKYISCGTNPSIPDFMKHQTILPGQTGIDIKLKSIDFTGMMFIDPNTDTGNMIYNDPGAGLNSTDFNTFLFSAVQDTNQQDWKDILSIDFDPNTATINLRASAKYSNPANGKSLIDLNNDYLDSVKLFNTDKILSNIIDSIFGTISSSVLKSLSGLEKEEEVNNIITNLINSEDGVIIDNSFFEFDTNDKIRQRQSVSDRKKGITKLATCGNVESTVSLETLQSVVNDILKSTTTAEKRDSVIKGIGSMGNELSTNVDDVDKPSVKLGFIDTIIEKLTLSITNIVLTPKVVLLIAMNYAIINNGKPSGDLDIIQFIKDNKVLFKSIIDSIKNKIVEYLLSLALKEISKLVSEQIIAKQTEKALAAKTQLLSLVGIPQDILRLISKLG